MCALIVTILLLAPLAFPQQGNEKTFASSGDAVLALYNAVKSNDQQALQFSVPMQEASSIPETM